MVRRIGKARRIDEGTVEPSFSSDPLRSTADLTRLTPI